MEGRVCRLLRLCDEHAEAADVVAAELARGRLLSHKLAYSGSAIFSHVDCSAASVVAGADGSLELNLCSDTLPPNENGTSNGSCLKNETNTSSNMDLQDDHSNGAGSNTELRYVSDSAIVRRAKEHFRAALAQCVRIAGIRADILECVTCLSAATDLIDLSSESDLSERFDHISECGQTESHSGNESLGQPCQSADSCDTSDDEDGVRALFGAEDAPQKKEGTAVTYVSPDKEEISLRLVGEHSLWGHHVWNAARWFADWACTHRDALAGLRVVELGAGAGLPSIAAARWGGASRVLATDYPDAELVANLSSNIAMCAPASVSSAGFLWGDAAFLHAHAGTFDVALLCDVVFNHSEHERLLRSVNVLLTPLVDVHARATHGEYPPIAAAELLRLLARRVPLAFVVFTHYRPWLAERDRDFLERAAAGAFAVRHVESRVLADAMFPADADDPRVVDPDVLRTVHAYVLVRREQDLDISGDEADP